MPRRLHLIPPLAVIVAFAIPVSPAEAELDGVELAQLSYRNYRERVVIRIPRLPQARRTAEPTATWEEKKAPKCVSANILASGAITPSGDVDLIATDGRRLRAKLDDNCPTLNFYGGFYIRRASDGLVCAGRDALRSRSGARCEINRFRTLITKK